MKLATFRRGGHKAIGAVDTARGQILDLAKASALASAASQIRPSPACWR